MPCGFLEFDHIVFSLRIDSQRSFYLLLHFLHFVMSGCTETGACKCSYLKILYFNPQEKYLTFCEIREPWSMVIPSHFFEMTMGIDYVISKQFIIMRYENIEKKAYTIRDSQRVILLFSPNHITFNSAIHKEWNNIKWTIQCNTGEVIFYRTVRHNGYLRIYDGPKVRNF